MATRLMAAGKADGFAATHSYTWYLHPVGYLYGGGAEVRVERIARDTYTLAKLYVRVRANPIFDAATTVRSRKNNTNGNQSVSIPASTTGGFEDNVNSDSLIDGNLFNSQCVTGGDYNEIYITVIAYSLTGSTSILGSKTLSLARNKTYYGTLLGYAYRTETELETQYTFRVTATLSNMRVYVSGNTLTADTTVRTRKNGANGNQAVTIGGAATGAFEDTGNTDSIVSGNTANFQVVTGDGPTGWPIYLDNFEVKIDSTGRPTGVARAGATGSLIPNRIRYLTVEGDSEILTIPTESETQTETRAEFEATNMFLRISANTIDGNSVFTLRKNTADTILQITVPASTTGVFEDSDSVDFALDDLIDWKVQTAGSSGTISPSLIAFEQSKEIPVFKGSRGYIIG